MIKNTYCQLFSITLLFILNAREENMTTTAKIGVRSATLAPNSVPNPKEGVPCMAEFTLMNVSGRADITATSKKPTMYLGTLKLLEIFREYLIACSALLMTKNNEKSRATKFSIFFNFCFFKIKLTNERSNSNEKILSFPSERNHQKA